jgi:hypothetical protein
MDPDYYPLTKVLTDNVPTVYHAWNLGISVARGKYITNANTDDRRHVDSMRVCAEVLDGRPDIDVVYHDQYISWENLDWLGFTKKYAGHELQAGRNEGKPGYFTWADYNRGVLGLGCFLGPMPMWRRSLHQRFGLFNSSMQSAGDYEFWLRVSGENNMLHLPWFGGVYRARLDGIELGNPLQSAEESRGAQILHQSRDLYFTPEPDGVVRVRMGNEWVFGDHDMVIDVLGRLNK